MQLFYSTFIVQAAQVPSPQTDFPVLLNPTDNRFRTVGNGGHVANANGYDLRPYSDSALTIPLTFELVPGTYNAVTGTFEMWVKLASVDVGSIIYLGYGDVALNTDGSSTATWSNGYLGVWHFPNGATLGLLDSTVNGNTGTNHGIATATTGKIDGALNLVAASSQYIDVGTSSALGSVIDCTLTAWVNVTNLASFNWIIAKTAINTPKPFDYRITPVTGIPNLVMGDGVTFGDVMATLPIVIGSFYYLCVTYSISGTTTNIIHYLNSAINGSGSVLGFTPLTGTNVTTIGTREDLFGFFDGVLDEITVSSVVRSADWVTTEYNNQNAPGTFYSIGAEAPVVRNNVLFTY